MSVFCSQQPLSQKRNGEPWWVFHWLRSRPAVVGLLLAAITLAVFWPALDCDFTNYDDPDYFSSNPHVLAGVTGASVAWAFRTCHMGYWQPLTWLSFMLDVTLFGTGPRGPHFTNLLLHGANVMLVFVLWRRMAGALWRSALAAGIFALHPLRVESVAWVCERKDVLSLFFGLLALLAYVRQVQSPEPETRRPAAHLRWMWHAAALLFFVLSLMSKPMLVTAPFVLVLLDFWPLRRFQFETRSSTLKTLSPFLWEKLPFFFLSAVFSVATFLAQRSAGAVASTAALSVPFRLETAVVAYARYLGKFFWPVNLANPCLLPGRWPWATVVWSAAWVMLLCASAWLSRRRLPFFFTGWFWFLGTLIPVSGLVQSGEQAMADRFTYLPSVGLVVAVVWSLHAASAPWRVSKPVMVVAAGLLLAACSALTVRQLSFWQNSDALFRHTIAVTEDNYVAYNNLGLSLSSRGRLEEAAGCFRKALQFNPRYENAMFNLGQVLGDAGRVEEAIDCYGQALRLNPRDAQALNNLGNALAGKKLHAEAFACYEAALAAKPDYAEAHYNYAVVLEALGKEAEAIRHYGEALKIAPSYADARNNLGNALARSGKLDEAVVQLRAGLSLNPNDARLHSNLGGVLELEGQLDQAREQYTQALRIAPEHAGAHNNLGHLLAKQQRFAEAAAQYQEALRLKPGIPETHLNLGVALIHLGRREEAIAHLQEALRLKPDYEAARRQLRATAPAE